MNLGGKPEVASPATGARTDLRCVSLDTHLSTAFHNYGDVFSGALYVEPTWVGRSNAIPPTTGSGRNVLMIGLGGRVRIRPTVYLLGKYSPVATGDNGGTDHGAVGIEKRVGGHAFQFNVSNSFATTLGQLAHGSATTNDWHIGFNITRTLF